MNDRSEEIERGRKWDKYKKAESKRNGEKETHKCMVVQRSTQLICFDCRAQSLLWRLCRLSEELKLQEEVWCSGIRKMMSKMLDFRYYTSASVVSVTETCWCEGKLPQCLPSTDYKVLERKKGILLGQDGKNLLHHNEIPRKYKHYFDLFSS